MSRAHHELDVPVDGGMLHVGVSEADTPDAPTALLIHGVTSSHLAWPFVADRLPHLRLVAPDLRGRGRSNTLAGPAGMVAHAADMVAVLDALDIDRVVVVGHSMGAFVSVVLADRYPDRVASLVLVDGGLPLDVPPGLDPDTAIRLVLGPTAERLGMRFASTDEYLDFWRAHPAFRTAWTSQLEAYLAYDLVDDGQGALRPATAYATVVDDTVDMNTGTAVPDALARMRHPARLFTVPRGLQDEPPGLYAPAYLDRLLADNPALAHRRIEGFNHYTIVMSPDGAQAIAPEIAAAVSAAPPRSGS
ncbi:alpha/beta fold hydrolase [Microbacterium protaetiae]|uniref:Alpha/beta fold hydrolase n=1 Tax=Microbacterium protaetiae TaxID=2509458 RepID=A0A4P6ELI6_9MICO|nr:alpha/beta hydrolase [Microbacterium protaetiae]QAY61087.1 alpha/beta fold hydrolase [Microbacterium protaetiae]